MIVAEQMQYPMNQQSAQSRLSTNSLPLRLPLGSFNRDDYIAQSRLQRLGMPGGPFNLVIDGVFELRK